MKKVLVLGAGMVARPLVQYLLDQPGYQLTVADLVIAKAQDVIAGRQNGQAVALIAGDNDTLEKLIADHDLSVSLLPAPLHPLVAELCIKHRKHMVTASYVSPKMKELDQAAKYAEVMILNEIGVDPGIDHMSAMRVIDDVKARGGKVTCFKSYCGGLPSPEDNDNPFGYKFSWSPRAVFAAGKNSALYRLDGREVRIPASELFADHHTLPVENIGELEAYPNRDSLSYIDTYGLSGIETMFRGTLRYPGWCETLKAFVDLGMLEERRLSFPGDMTFAQFFAKAVGLDSDEDLRERIAEKLSIEEASPILCRFDWLGLFSNDLIPLAGQDSTAMDVLCAVMEKKMVYHPGERDMICLVHRFRAEFPDGSAEKISSTLIDFGIPNGDSSMARTVGLPAAIGAKMILNGEVFIPGVQIPVIKDIYEPVLNALAQMDIRCTEITQKA